MFEKIRHKDDAASIVAGTMLVEYPIDGSSSDEIDLSDTTLFRLYEVDTNERGIITARNENNVDESGQLARPIDTLVEDNRWWIRNELKIR